MDNRKQPCRVGICTGCHFIVRSGPYFKRRMIRHLNDPRLQHNHDAFSMMTIGEWERVGAWSGPVPRYLNPKISWWKLEAIKKPDAKPN